MRQRNLTSLILSFAIISLVLMFAGWAIMILAEQSFGPPSPLINTWQRLNFSLVLILHGEDLTAPIDARGKDQEFEIPEGESVISISRRLQEAGLIRDAGLFRTYLTWKGLDTSVQTGTYRLSPTMTAVEIAQTLQDYTLTEITFNILPGWRLEEIAAALPTSGLVISPNEFLVAASKPDQLHGILPVTATAEGFLFPDTYSVLRSTTAGQFIGLATGNFVLHLTPDLQNGFTDQGLSVYQAVILASIIEREAIFEDEMPVIASVFLNRWAIGMKMESDATVQYALGYDSAAETWWTNPLSWDDLLRESPFNTYIHSGLPPAPIANPGLAALQAVAFPDETDYLYFMARCDGSGYHRFAETFEEHIKNLCP